MAEKSSYQEKIFRIPDSPLEVKLSIQRDQPPLLRVAAYGPKHDEHKDPRYNAVASHLLKELKVYIAASDWFPKHGGLEIDYQDELDLSLHIHYPSGPTPHYPVTPVDMLIRDPIDKASRWWKDEKNADKLFETLTEKMPAFIRELKPVMERERFSSAKNSHGQHSSELKTEKEKKDAYDMLGVTPNTPWEKIKKTYHDKARAMHPDTKGGVDDGSFHKLQTAYDLIKKCHKKSGK